MMIWIVYDKNDIVVEITDSGIMRKIVRVNEPKYLKGIIIDTHMIAPVGSIVWRELDERRVLIQIITPMSELHVFILDVIDFNFTLVELVSGFNRIVLTKNSEVKLCSDKKLYVDGNVVEVREILFDGYKEYKF